VWERARKRRLGGIVGAGVAAAALFGAGIALADPSIVPGTVPAVQNVPVFGTAATINGTLTPNQAFVARLYPDLLGRQVGPGELSLATGSLDGGAPRSSIVGGILATDELKRVLVANFYSSYLHRAAAPSDLSFWVGQLQAGASIDTLRSTILGSNEYFSVRATGDNTSWLDAVYDDVLFRLPSSTELTGGQGALAGGTSRTDFSLGLVKSSEARQREIDGFYFQFLARAPTAQTRRRSSPPAAASST
jgi:hypothetical protein